MGSQIICCPSILPSYNDLAELLSPFYSVPDITLPTQLTVPSPIWPAINIPQAELEMTITEMLQSQLTGVTVGLFKPVTKYLGLNLKDVVPDIPGFPGLNIIDLLDGSIDEMVALAKSPNFDFSAIPLLPSPIYPGLELPARQALVAVQTAVNGYLQILSTVVTNLINKITDILELPGLVIPKFPTLDDILALLPTPPSLEDLRNQGADLLKLLPGLRGMPSLHTLADLLGLSIPGFLFKLELPSPLIPNINIPAYDFLQGLKNLYSGLTTEVLSIIVRFVNRLPLSFSFPTFCLPIVTPDLPALPGSPNLV